MLDIVDKYFKSPIINILGELKETILKKLKKDLMTMSHQIEYQ